MTTSSKMILIGCGATKEDVGWTENDEAVLQSLIPDQDKLLEALRKSRVIKSNKGKK